MCMSERINRKYIYICSAYRGDVGFNIKKACEYSKFVVLNGHIPIVVHLMFPQFLDDNIEAERKLGISMGLDILSKIDEVWVFGSKISEGMEAEILHAEINEKMIRYFDENCCKLVPALDNS